jgi:hypothetical protein
MRRIVIEKIPITEPDRYFWRTAARRHCPECPNFDFLFACLAVFFANFAVKSFLAPKLGHNLIFRDAISVAAL